MAMKSPQDNEEFLSEINVTPLVDVMLVLLVIFMVSAPLLMNDVALKLPKTKKVQQLNSKRERVVISINKNGEYFLNQKGMLFSDLLKSINAKFKKQEFDLVYIRADEQTDYRYVANLIATLKYSGIEQISLITEIEK